MTLWVDFNRVDKAGRVPAIIRGSAGWQIEEGDLVLAEDGEGTRVKAYVEELRRSAVGGKTIAYLQLLKGTAEYDVLSELVADDMQAVIAEDLGYREVAAC